MTTRIAVLTTRNPGVTATSRKRVAILISGRGSNMAALIEAATTPNYPAEIAVVISNRPDATGLAHATAAGIATATIDHGRFGNDREAFERALDRELRSRAVDLVCLAGFMRLLTPWLPQQWQHRMLNIHPSLLPAFKGLHTHEAALRAGVRIHGATVHFVVPEVDSGPVICQGAVAVHDDDTPTTLADRVLVIEHRLYPLALQLVAEGRVHVEGGRCIVTGTTAVAGALIVPGHPLTADVRATKNPRPKPGVTGKTKSR